MAVKLIDFWAPWCIDPETPVLTENGYLKASQIHVGQKLVTIDPKTRKQVIKKVSKIKIFQDMQSKKITLETGTSLIGDINHQVLTTEGFKKLEELAVGEKVLVNPLSAVNKLDDSVILARLLGFVMTDGYLYENLKHHIHETHFFVGTKEDAEEIKKDLQFLGFNQVKIEKRTNKRTIDSRDFVITTYRVRSFKKALFELLKSKGAPVGRKKNQAYFIPDWIMDGSTGVKRGFLSGWLGGDGCKIDYRIRHGGTSSHHAGFNINTIEFHKEKELEREGILYAKQLAVLLEELGIEVREISSSEDEDGVIIFLRISNSYPSLLNLAKIGYAYASTKNKSTPFIREFLQYRLKERNNYAEIKQAVLEQLALGVSNKNIAESLQVPLQTVISWRYQTRDSNIVHPSEKGEALFTKWLEERQQGELLWEKVSLVEEIDSRDVIGITVGEPYTILTNGIVSHNCGPCKVMAPILEELKKELGEKVEIEEINVDENQAKASEFGVMSIPTYVILKDGKEVGRKIGVTAKADLLKLLQS